MAEKFMFEYDENQFGPVGEYERHNGEIWHVTTIKGGRTKRVFGEPVELPTREQEHAAGNSERRRLGFPAIPLPAEAPESVGADADAADDEESNSA